MKYHCKLLLFSFALLLFLAGCNDKDERFERPGWLAGPIYTQLKDLGNCNLYIQCLDRTPYAKLLNSTSTYTVFAPTDSAFQVYLTEKGYSSVADMPQKWVDDYVRYSIVDYGYSTEFIDKSSVWSGGWENASGGDSWRRRTLFIDDIKEEDYSSTTPYWPGKLLVAPNFYKTIAYFTERFSSRTLFTADDYATIYPGGNPLGKFNIFDASVVKADVIAENGYIHVVNKVIEVKKNLYEYLAEKSDYSLFKAMLDRLIYPKYVGYITDSAGVAYPVYNKTFFNPNGGPINSVTQRPEGEDYLSYNPCNENYGDIMGDNTYQTNMEALFVPTNDALKDFFENVLLKNFGSLDKVPTTVIAAYINGLIQQKASLAWPSKWPNINTNNGDKITLAKSDIADAEVCSNGVFYGVKNAMVPSFFGSVIGFSYLDANYTIFNRGIEKLQLRTYLSNNDAEFTIFAISDAAFRSYGLNMDPLTGKIFTIVDGQDASIIFERIMNMHVVAGKYDDLSAKTFIRTNKDEVIMLSGGKVYGAGNTDVQPFTGITPSSKLTNAFNGVVYELPKLMMFTDSAIGKRIFYMPEFSEFKKLLTTAGVMNPDGSIISTFLDPTTDYTVFAPTNAAILAEKDKGVASRIPATASELVKYLQNYFIARDFLFTTDPDPNRSFFNLYEKGIVDGSPDYAKLMVQISGGKIVLTDITGGTASTTGTTDVLAFHGVIHQIDQVLNVKP